MRLADYLASKQKAGVASPAVATIIARLASAAVTITALIRQNGLTKDLAVSVGGVNPVGEEQKRLDVLADSIIAEGLADSGAAYMLSEEQATPLALDKNGKGKGDVLVAVDPLDGSSNIDVNVTIGTIFSLMPHNNGATPSPCLGRQQLATGFFAYGPQTVLLVGLADEDSPPVGFVLDEARGSFVLIDTPFTIPPTTKEFAINAAYAGYWFPPMRRWMADTQAGKQGPLGKDYRLRWVGSLVADAWRIFRRGGVFLYPADARPGNADGRLRLVYEANPIAFLVEKAGGAASNGSLPILDVPPQAIHQRTPLFFGSSEEVARLIALHNQEK